MFVTFVCLDIKPECVEDFIKVTLYNHENTRKEKANIRFDVIRNMEDPNKFSLYEVFEDQAGMDFHKTTEHYLKWRDAVANYMATPRTVAKYDILAFN